MERLRRDGIAAAQGALANEIQDSGSPIELIVVGGAALVLLYNARESTKDVDAFATDATTTARLLQAARRVADLCWGCRTTGSTMRPKAMLRA